MEGTPSDRRKWIERITGFTGLYGTPGATPERENSFSVQSPALSATPISESDYEVVTKESLDDYKREHPAAALEKLTVIRKTPEIKKEYKPKLTPEMRKEIAKNRLKEKLLRKSEEKSPKNKTEIKIEPKMELENAPATSKLNKNVRKSKIPVATNKRVEALK